MSHKEETRLSPAGKAASVALAELQKAIRFFRLYPREHPFCARSLEEAHSRIDGYFQKHGALEVEVGREGLLMDEQTVLAASDQSTDISSLLNPEGVRELTFEVGLPQDELFDFAVILSAHYPEGTGPDDEANFTNDLLTALWKRDFGHLHYRLHDQLSAHALRGAQDHALVGVVERAEGVFAGLRRAALPALPELDADAYVRRLEEQGAGQGGPQGSDPEQVDAFLESPLGEERRRLLDELHDPHMGDVLARSSDIVLWGSLQQDQAPDARTVARFLAGATLSALDRGELEQAGELLGRVADADGEVPALLPPMIQRLSSGAGLQLLSKALEARRPAVDPDDLVRTGLGYLDRLEDAAIAGACEVYPQVTHDAVRRVFRRYLSARVERGTEPIARLTTHEDPKVVRDAVGMLAVAAEGSEARKILAEVAQKEQDSARGGVAREVLQTVTGERSRRALFEVARSDPDKRRRMLAVKRIKEDGSLAAFNELSELISAPEFAQREEDELHVFMDALTSLGGLRAVRVLQELAGRRSLLFGRKDLQRLRSTAEAWLRQMRQKRGPGTGRTGSGRTSRPGGEG